MGTGWVGQVLLLARMTAVYSTHLAFPPPSPMISSWPASPDLRMSFLRVSTLRRTPRISTFSICPCFLLMWMTLSVWVLGVYLAMSSHCDYLCLWCNLSSPPYTTPPVWLLDGFELLPTKSFWGGHKPASLSWPCGLTTHTGHPGKLPCLPPAGAALLFVSRAQGFTNPLFLVLSLPPPPFHPAWCLKTSLVRICHSIGFHFFLVKWGSEN